LDKIIDLVYTVPGPLDIEKLALTSVGWPETKNTTLQQWIENRTAVGGFSESEKDAIAVMFLAPQCQNPRLLKSIMHTLALCFRFMLEESQHVPNWRYHTPNTIVWLLAYVIHLVSSPTGTALSELNARAGVGVSIEILWVAVAGVSVPATLRPLFTGQSVTAPDAQETNFLESLVRTKSSIIIRSISTTPTVTSP
jgi:hypothetical protein